MEESKSGCLGYSEEINSLGRNSTEAEKGRGFPEIQKLRNFASELLYLNTRVAMREGKFSKIAL